MEHELRQMFEMKETEMTVPPTLSPELRNRIGKQRMVIGGLAAAAAFVLVIGGFAGARSLSNDAAPVPPAEETEEDETGDDFPNLTSTFVSPTNGFSVKHPDRAELAPAKAEDDWDGGDEVADEGIDVVETGLAAVFKGASTKLPNLTSLDEWVDGMTPGGCAMTLSQHTEITIDGRPGWIAECPNEIDASVAAGGRVYLFTLLHDRSDARDVFDAFAATIDLTPETAVDAPEPTWVELQMNMKGTFVSPLNGYSFKYLDRGGLEPATELWDPVNQPSPVEDLGGYGAEYQDEFDFVETGYGAIFMSASTKIPGGVSVDEWIDEAVGKYLPAGCYGSRSQQERITIDGEPGRISECPGLPDTDPRERIDTSTTGVTHATVVKDGRLYLFKIAHGAPTTDDARKVFDAWVATIELTPETAAAP